MYKGECGRGRVGVWLVVGGVVVVVVVVLQCYHLMVALLYHHNIYGSIVCVVLVGGCICYCTLTKIV